ncbi:MAG: acylphosphatase [Bacteroidetes bacterium]|nr:acylphosphatase [Bacteroidota bacterium]
MEKRYRITITGRVQGVYYRASTQRQAQSLNLSGWVRNKADGSVEAEAQGPEPQLLALLKWCEKGPEFARVDAVTHAEISLQEEDGFVIKRSVT